MQCGYYVHFKYYIAYSFMTLCLFQSALLFIYWLGIDFLEAVSWNDLKSDIQERLFLHHNTNFNRNHSLKPIEVEKYNRQKVEINSRDTNRSDRLSSNQCILLFCLPSINFQSVSLLSQPFTFFRSTSMDFYPGSGLGSSLTSDILPINHLVSYIEPFS